MLTMHSDLGSEILDVLVGPQMALFKVHKKLLCDKAPGFRALVGRDPQSSAIKDVGMDERAFEILVGWLYSGSVRPIVVVGRPGVVVKDVMMSELWDRVRLCCLAENYRASTLMDPVMSSIVDLCKAKGLMPTLGQMDYCFKNCVDGSMLTYLMATCLGHMVLYTRPDDNQVDNDEIKRVLQRSNGLMFGL